MNPDKQNEMTKIRPFYDMIAKSCIENWPDSPDLSVDESVVPYYVQNNSKQRMQSKPVRSGCKMWVLAEPLGYAVNFDPYQDAKNGVSTQASEKTWIPGETVVLYLLDALPKQMCYIFFMDVL